jgi:acyl dehydratase
MSQPFSGNLALVFTSSLKRYSIRLSYYGLGRSLARQVTTPRSTSTVFLRREKLISRSLYHGKPGLPERRGIVDNRNPDLTHPIEETSMLVVETPKDLKQHIGKTLGPSDWLVVDQAMIDKFAEATGDHQWIHVDVERAKKEMPGGKTIAHGYLTLSLLPRLTPQLLKVEKRKRGLNYGSNKIRFTNTVPAGSRIRLKQTIKNVEDVEGNGVRITSEMVIEVEGQERPALVAEVMGIQYA